jgi:hypothetical protein
MAGEPQGQRQRGVWAQRWYAWWPPAAAFLGVLLAVPLLVLGVAYAIAGGNDLYALEPTQSCLEDVDGVRTSPREKDVNDFVAEAAINGALRVWLPANQVVISFGESNQDAERTERAYLRFSGATIPVKDLLRRNQNAVLLWIDKPSARDEKTVEDCLS